MGPLGTAKTVGARRGAVGAQPRPWRHGQGPEGWAMRVGVQPRCRGGTARGREVAARGCGGAAKAVWGQPRTWLRPWGHCQGAVKSVGADPGAVRAQPRRLGRSQGMSGHGQGP